MQALRAIEGFENVKVYRPAYAVEYDFFDPTQLDATLESRVIPGLYLAGQVNGTTGYEEAAAQGLMAGINAHLSIAGKEPLILKRDEAYIGVLIDDLITKGVDEPYRMFTSRAEYRILLRQDDADRRLTRISYQLGLATQYRYDTTCRKYDCVEKYISFAKNTSVKPDTINGYLEAVNSSPITISKRIDELISRPDVSMMGILENVPRGTLDSTETEIHEIVNSITLMKGEENEEIKTIYNIPWKPEPGILPTSMEIERDVLNSVREASEIAIKYKGYIEREKRVAEKILRLEDLKIPDNFDFQKITALSIECRMKLERYRPRTIAQASRISGVSPADISVLLVYFGR